MAYPLYVRRNLISSTRMINVPIRSAIWTSSSTKKTTVNQLNGLCTMTTVAHIQIPKYGITAQYTNRRTRQTIPTIQGEKSRTNIGTAQRRHIKKFLIQKAAGRRLLISYPPYSQFMGYNAHRECTRRQSLLPWMKRWFGFDGQANNCTLEDEIFSMMCSLYNHQRLGWPWLIRHLMIHFLPVPTDTSSHFP